MSFLSESPALNVYTLMAIIIGVVFLDGYLKNKQ